ncbi:MULTISPECIES: mandelate racemase/muconate lactonizing enzyme family protein [Haloarcula]|uniref:mandelate racemase/muconate lactonizing enzyme family protein n=1 Tax=Haloarcula TaxID=2237 RepID=UPI0023EB981C|nr:mandelate racemase/muconate lactonizing enzyme family protein [Halomicroarcula sp. XH51]
MTTVTDLETGLYRVPNEEALEDATQSFDALELVVASVTTDDGHSGLGFTYTIGDGGATIREFLESTLREDVVGAGAAPRAARERLLADTTFVGREGISELAIAAVDVALWDRLGRALDAPLYELLGGERRSVPAYQTDGGWLQYDTEALVENAATAASRGFAGMKMKVGRGHAEDAARIAAVREALPPEMDLMIDGNCSYSVPEARRLADRIDVPVDWFEEPLPKGDYTGHADLRDRIDVPVALGENLYSERQFTQVLATGAADVLQPDVCRVGGVSPWMTVAEMADAWGLPVSPHYVEPLHVHLAAAVPNVPYVEHHSTVLDGVMTEPPELADGGLRPPSAPGHGIEFDGLEAYRVAGGIDVID